MGLLSSDHRDLRSLLSKAAMSHVQLPWPSVDGFLLFGSSPPTPKAKGTPSVLSVPCLSDALSLLDYLTETSGEM